MCLFGAKLAEGEREIERERERGKREREGGRKIDNGKAKGMY